MARIEKFKPQLKPGRLIPQGEKLIYETESPYDQIILPIESVDFLLLCNGANTIEDIIETLYFRKGMIQFKVIHKTMYFLKSRGFLVNGDELDFEIQDQSFNNLQFLSFKPILNISIGKRIFNESEHPILFYSLAMIATLFSIFCMQTSTSDWLRHGFLKLNGSYVTSLLFMSVATSILLSAKNILKCLMLILLTGRAYNFSLVFNGLSFYFHVKSDSLFLISNRLYLTLFHLSVTLCYFPITYIFYFLFQNVPFMNENLYLCFALVLFDLNPFQESELSFFLRSLFNDDTINKISKYQNHKSLLAILSPLERNRDHNLYFLFTCFALAWSTTVLYACWTALVYNSTEVITALRTAVVPERVIALVTSSFIITLSFIVAYNSVILFFGSFVIPTMQRIWGRIQKKKSHRLDFYNRNEILTALEGLPLFNYFNKELLNLIIQKSELKEYAKEMPVIVQGDDARHLFVLLNGSLQVRKKYGPHRVSPLAEILPPSIFGEIAVIEEVKRVADVVATSKSIILEVPATMLRQLAKDSQYIRELDSFKNAIMVGQFFSSAPVFREVSDVVVQLFTSKGKIEIFEKNQILFQQDSPGDGFYLLLRGSVGVSVNGRPIARIQQGGFFGEVSMIADVPRTATIHALENIQTLKISRDAFWEILSHDMTMAMFIESVGEMRIREDLEILKAHTVRVA